MAPPTLDPANTSLQTLRDHWIFTKVRLQSEPLAASLLAPYTAFGAQWQTVWQTGQDLRDATLVAAAGVVGADRACDKASDQVSAAIHDGKKPDVSLPLHQLFYGNLTPSEARRPVLGTQLTMMAQWPPLLGQASQPSLQALQAPVTGVVTGGQAAETTRDQATAAYNKFRLDGDLPKLFDVYNALTATTYAGLKSVALANPAAKLGTDWPDSFFMHETRAPATVTPAQAATNLKKAQDQLTSAQAVHDQIAVDQKAAADAAAAAAKADADAETAKGTVKQAKIDAKTKIADAKKKQKDAAAAARKAKRVKKPKPTT